jgi:hypothetical protein
VEKTGENRYRVWPNEMPADLHKVRPHQALNRNLDHNWQQALLKTSSERRIAVDIELSGWQEQLVLTMTCEDGVSVTHTLDGEFAEANQAEKALANLRDGVAKLGQTIYYARDVGQSAARCLCPTACSTSCVVKRRKCWMKRASTGRAAPASRSPCRRRSTRRPSLLPRQRL